MWCVALWNSLTPGHFYRTYDGVPLLALAEK